MKNTGGDQYATGISQLEFVGIVLRLKHVTVQVTGAVLTNVAALNNGAQLLVSDSTVVATGGTSAVAIFSTGAGSAVETLRGAGGGAGGTGTNFGIVSIGNAAVAHSRITGDTASIGATGIVDASYSRLSGGPVASGTDDGAAVSDEFNTFYTGTACP